MQRKYRKFLFLDIMKIILRRYFLYHYQLMVLLIFILCYPFFYFSSKKESRFLFFNFFRKRWAFLSSALSGIFYRYKFEEAVDWSRTYIICPNHASNLDISAISIMMKNNFFFLGKEELLDHPLMRIFFKSVDIPVNRNNKISAYKSFIKVEQRLLSGMSVIIFPEGKIGNDFPPLLHEFKNGPFKLAIKHKIPILPVSIQNNWEILWDDGQKYGCKPGISHICIQPLLLSPHPIRSRQQ